MDLDYVLRTNYKPFINTVYNTVVMAAAAVSQETLQIQSEADFVLTEIRTTGTKGVGVFIQDTNGNNYNNTSFDASNIGAGQNKLVLAAPTLFPKNTQLSIILTNGTGGQLAINDFSVNFIGYLKY